MARYRLGFVSLLAAGALVLTCQLALAAEFSADFTGSTGKQMAGAGTIYVKGRNLRREARQGPLKYTAIFSFNKKMMWFVDPAKKTYWGQPVPAKDAAAQEQALRGNVASHPGEKGLKVTRLGTETVSGYPCEKTMIEGKGLKVVTWYSKKLEFALKTEGTVTMGNQKMVSREQYKNIRERKLSDSLFAPPAGYKQVSPPQRPAMQGPPSGRRGGRARRGR
jgi:outer membrane lipoprotein-sorting protein